MCGEICSLETSEAPTLRGSGGQDLLLLLGGVWLSYFFESVSRLCPNKIKKKSSSDSSRILASKNCLKLMRRPTANNACSYVERRRGGHAGVSKNIGFGESAALGSIDGRSG